MNLTEAAREMHSLRKQLAEHLEASKLQEVKLRAHICHCTDILATSANGLDPEKIALARTVVFASGSYVKGGDDRASVISDAIKQLSTGEPVRPTYNDLWTSYFGTKSYDRWHGQRSDHPYGMGPGHGSTIFRVGIVEDVRKTRKQSDLTPDEVEAAIYYLVNLERVQAAEQTSREQAAA